MVSSQFGKPEMILQIMHLVKQLILRYEGNGASFLLSDEPGKITMQTHRTQVIQNDAPA